MVTNQKRARMSFATFFYPADDVEIDPLGTMLNCPKGSGLRLYRKVIFGEYLREFMKSKLQGKAHTEKAKLPLEV